MNNVKLLHIKCCFFQFFSSLVATGGIEKWKKNFAPPQEKVEMTPLIYWSNWTCKHLIWTAWEPVYSTRKYLNKHNFNGHKLRSRIFMFLWKDLNTRTVLLYITTGCFAPCSVFSALFRTRFCTMLNQHCVCTGFFVILNHVLHSVSQHISHHNSHHVIRSLFCTLVYTVFCTLLLHHVFSTSAPFLHSVLHHVLASCFVLRIAPSLEP